VQEQDVEAFVRLQQGQWVDLLKQEGTYDPSLFENADPNGELPCPACGTQAPLVEGACSDCGLHLA
jgi:hypothetical protein